MRVLKKQEALSKFERGEVADDDQKRTAKFVRTWRSKSDGHGKYWLRISRLVAREYQFLEERNDVYSPSSSSSIVRLLPALRAFFGWFRNPS